MGGDAMSRVSHLHLTAVKCDVPKCDEKFYTGSVASIARTQAGGGGLVATQARNDARLAGVRTRVEQAQADRRLSDAQTEAADGGW